MRRRVVRSNHTLLRICAGATVFGYLIGALALQLCPAYPVHAQSRAEEYRVKAAFIFHFAQSVEWPSDAMKSSSAPFNVCVLGEDPFHGALDESMENKAVGSRPIRVSHVKNAGQASGCQVLFISEVEAKRLSAPLGELKNGATLTIGDTEEFVLQQGGMIGFCLENDRVRFDINASAASRRGIKISSRLLLLAKVVIGNQAQK